MRILLVGLLLMMTNAPARADVAGDFDYYVLSLSWSPSWCAAEGDARGAAQCERGRGIGFTLHGLWPQYEAGWPEYCSTTASDPSRAETGAMADIMGSGGLAWYQWKKHGRCAGLTSRDYFNAARAAFEAVELPDALQDMTRQDALSPVEVEALFLEANPALSADGITLTCKQARLVEARICLTRELEPRDCAPDTRRDCPLREMLILPPR